MHTQNWMEVMEAVINRVGLNELAEREQEINKAGKLSDHRHR